MLVDNEADLLQDRPFIPGIIPTTPPKSCRCVSIYLVYITGPFPSHQTTQTPARCAFPPRLPSPSLFKFNSASTVISTLSRSILLTKICGWECRHSWNINRSCLASNNANTCLQTRISMWGSLWQFTLASCHPS